ncbi:unnamed protein product [Amoebophrya sp. A25]|nr:unnamed protein product [Amoebophrya sp. A25]|eukprot:GSA25T00025682001.1
MGPPPDNGDNIYSGPEYEKFRADYLRDLLDPSNLDAMSMTKKEQFELADEAWKEAYDEKARQKRIEDRRKRAARNAGPSEGGSGDDGKISGDNGSNVGRNRKSSDHVVDGEGHGLGLGATSSRDVGQFDAKSKTRTNNTSACSSKDVAVEAFGDEELWGNDDFGSMEDAFYFDDDGMGLGGQAASSSLQNEVLDCLDDEIARCSDEEPRRVGNKDRLLPSDSEDDRGDDAKRRKVGGGVSGSGAGGTKRGAQVSSSSDSTTKCQDGSAGCLEGEDAGLGTSTSTTSSRNKQIKRSVFDAVLEEDNVRMHGTKAEHKKKQAAKRRAKAKASSGGGIMLSSDVHVDVAEGFYDNREDYGVKENIAMDLDDMGPSFKSEIFDAAKVAEKAREDELRRAKSVEQDDTEAKLLWTSSTAAASSSSSAFLGAAGVDGEVLDRKEAEALKAFIVRARVKRGSGLGVSANTGGGFGSTSSSSSSSCRPQGLQSAGSSSYSLYQDWPATPKTKSEAKTWNEVPAEEVKAFGDTCAAIADLENFTQEYLSDKDRRSFLRSQGVPELDVSRVLARDFYEDAMWRYEVDASTNTTAPSSSTPTGTSVGTSSSSSSSMPPNLQPPAKKHGLPELTGFSPHLLFKGLCEGFYGGYDPYMAFAEPPRVAWRILRDKDLRDHASGLLMVPSPFAGATCYRRVTDIPSELSQAYAWSKTWPQLRDYCDSVYDFEAPPITTTKTAKAKAKKKGGKADRFLSLGNCTKKAASSGNASGWDETTQKGGDAPFDGVSLNARTNDDDQEAAQPRHFTQREYQLRPEQLRELCWMIRQEQSTTNFLQLANLEWREPCPRDLSVITGEELNMEKRLQSAMDKLETARDLRKKCIALIGMESIAVGLADASRMLFREPAEEFIAEADRRLASAFTPEVKINFYAFYSQSGIFDADEDAQPCTCEDRGALLQARRRRKRAMRAHMGADPQAQECSLNDVWGAKLQARKEFLDHFICNAGQQQLNQDQQESEALLKANQERTIHQIRRRYAEYLTDHYRNKSAQGARIKVSDQKCDFVEMRIEGPKMRVRGGVLNDNLGYGKTCLAIALTDRTLKQNVLPPDDPAFIASRATLVVMPSHLLNQWHEEIEQFTGTEFILVKIATITDLKKLTVREIKMADVVLCCERVFDSPGYKARVRELAIGFSNKLGYYRASAAQREGKLASFMAECYNDNKDTGDSSGSGSEQQGQLFPGTMKHSTSSSANMNIFGVKQEEGGLGQSAANGDQSIDEPANRNNRNVKDLPTERHRWSRSNLWESEFEVRFAALRGVAQRIQRYRGDEVQGAFVFPVLELFHFRRLVADELHEASEYHPEMNQYRPSPLRIEQPADARALDRAQGIPTDYTTSTSTLSRKSSEKGSTVSPLPFYRGRRTLICLQRIRSSYRWALSGTLPKENRAVWNQFFSFFTYGKSVLAPVQDTARAFDIFVRSNTVAAHSFVEESHLVHVEMSLYEYAIYLSCKQRYVAGDADLLAEDGGQGAGAGAQADAIAMTAEERKEMKSLATAGKSGKEILLRMCSHFQRGEHSADDLHNSEDETGRLKKAHEKKVEACVNRIRSTCRKIESYLRGYYASLQGATNAEKRERMTRYRRFKRLGLYLEMIDDPEAKDGKRFTRPTGGSAVAYVAEQINLAAREGEDRLRVDRSVNSLHLFESAVEEQTRNEKKAFDDLKAACRNRDFLASTLDTLRKARDGEAPEDGCAICLENEGINEWGLLPCSHMFCFACVSQQIRQMGSCPSCRMELREDDISKVDLKAQNQNAALEKRTDDKSREGKYGSKLKKIIDILRNRVPNDEKVILFVQWDDLKRKIAKSFVEFEIPHLTLQGSVHEKRAILNKFKDDVRVLILSMEDAASGANLTESNHVFLVHPFWDESEEVRANYEKQAIGRIRRYGQKRTVHVWRFIARDTLEERMVPLAALRLAGAEDVDLPAPPPPRNAGASQDAANGAANAGARQDAANGAANGAAQDSVNAPGAEDDLLHVDHGNNGHAEQDLANNVEEDPPGDDDGAPQNGEESPEEEFQDVLENGVDGSNGDGANASLDEDAMDVD